MNSPALAEAACGTLADLIRSHAARAPDQAALRQDGRELSYAALDALMDGVAAALQRDGVAPQDAIAICAGTSLEYATVFLGALRAGVAVAPLAPSGTPSEIAAMAADAGARLLFLDASVVQALAPVAAHLTTQRIALDDSTTGTPLRHWLAPAGATPAPVAVQPHWPFNIIYSSGTTGVPKGIVQSHAMRWGHMQRAAIYGYGRDTVSLLATVTTTAEILDVWGRA